MPWSTQARAFFEALDFMMKNSGGQIREILVTHSSGPGFPCLIDQFENVYQNEITTGMESGSVTYYLKGMDALHPASALILKQEGEGIELFFLF